MDKILAKKILIKTKEEYRDFCKNQFFCEKCEYNTKTADRIDCFERFYINNFEYIVSKINR